MKPKIFVTLSTFAEHGDTPLRMLEKSGFPFSVNHSGKRITKEEIVTLGRDASGVIAGVEIYDEYVLENMPLLRCISRCGVGIDNIALEKTTQKGIVIRNTPDVVVQPVVELTIGMIFDLLRRLSLHTALIKAGKWEKITGNLLQGKRIGILGLGRIGKRTAETLVKLGCAVQGTDIMPDKAWADAANITIVPVDELLRTSDIVSIHLSSMRDKPFLLGKKELASMKKGSFLINVSRGQFVDEEELYSALKSGHLAGAGLDVFSHEPYSGKLSELETIILTPHIATLTEESRLAMEIEATKNLLEFFGSHA